MIMKQNVSNDFSKDLPIHRVGDTRRSSNGYVYDIWQGRVKAFCMGLKLATWGDLLGIYVLYLLGRFWV